MRTPEVEQAMSNTESGMYCTDDADTLAAEVERMEAECRYKHECMRQFMEEASLANKRAEAAEARVAEMEKKLMRQEEVAREAYEAAVWKYGQERMELEAQNARLLSALENIVKARPALYDMNTLLRFAGIAGDIAKAALAYAERLSCAEVLTRDDVGNDGEGYATGVPELGEGDVIYIVRADRLREEAK